MSIPSSPFNPSGKTVAERFWALLNFLFAVIYVLVAHWIANSASNGLTSGDWKELIYRSILLFLLLVGFWAMGYAFQRQRTPLKSMGLIRRKTSLQEFGIGAAFGWGAMILCVFPIALFGGITLTFWTGPRQFGRVGIDLLVLLVAALAEEVAFRGYPFQRLIEAMGPVLATLVLSAVFGTVHLGNPDSTMASTAVTVIAGWLFAIAYLRTRALWLPWGLHFAWNASMGILFGLPVSGLRTFSPVVSANTHGPIWLTGDGYGPEGSLVSIVVLLVSLGVLTWVTSDLAFEYAHPIIIAGGIPVDIDAAAKRQHEEAMASPAETTPKLVQILPLGAPLSQETSPMSANLPSPLDPGEAPVSTSGS